MNPTILRMAALTLLFALSPCGHADVLKIPLGSQSADAASNTMLPQHGMSAIEVLSGWGKPAVEHAAVGSPPIMRWEYPTFDVYFENTTVLHSVLHFRAKAAISPTDAASSE